MKNVKLLFAASLSLTSIDNAMATGFSRGLEGLSLGGQIGYITQDSRISQHYNFEPFRHKSKDLSGRGVIGGLNLAWGYIFSNHLFLGIEAKGELSSLKGSQSEGPLDIFQNKINLKMKNSFGGALKVGGVISSVLPYLRAGILSSEWHSTSPISVGNDIGMGKKHKRLIGFEAGIGVEIPLPESAGLGDKVTVGGEYTHVEYEKFSYRCMIQNDDPDCSCDSLLKVSPRPRTDAFMLRLRYRVY